MGAAEPVPAPGGPGGPGGPGRPSRGRNTGRPGNTGRNTGSPGRPAPDASTTPAPSAVLLDDRYEVRRAISHASKGGVYLATDRTTGQPVVVKQARPHLGATLVGGDVRDALRHEAAMLRELEPLGLSPRLVGLFEQQGDLFLAEEAVEGTSLTQWVHERMEPVGDGLAVPLALAVPMARRLVALVAAVHEHGLVLRDLKPDNLMVRADGTLRLVDVESLARPGELALNPYTPGFAAPEQRRARGFGAVSEQSVDLYALGATLFHLGSGGDPALAPEDPVSRRSDRERLGRWLSTLPEPTPRALTPVVHGLLADDPAARLPLSTVDRLLETSTSDRAPLAGPLPGPGLAAGEQDRLIRDGLAHLLDGAQWTDPDRLWPPGPDVGAADPLAVQHGAAGVLGVLTRAHDADPDLVPAEAVRRVADWLRRRVRREPRVLPGLHFGRSGTAWALLDAAETLADQQLSDVGVELARRVPVEWPNPDVCHGAAGAGLLALRAWESTGDTGFLDRVRQGAERLLAVAEHRGQDVLWPVPADFDSSLAGITYYGFAHGVAGVAAFLLGAADATGDRRFLDAAVEAGGTLVRAARLDRGAATWPADARDPDGGLTHWCSGSSGIGTFLLRLWQRTGDPALLERCHEAAVAVRRSRAYAGVSVCHGLAGDGDFLLDLAAATGDERYTAWAAVLAESIHARHAARDGRVVVPVDTGRTVTVDYGTGTSGVVSFMLRLRHGGPRLWLPRCLDAADRRERQPAAALIGA